jgi:hypothetical protein
LNEATGRDGGPARALSDQQLGSWRSINANGVFIDECDRDKLNDPVGRDRRDLVRPIRNHPDQPVVQGAALIVLVMGARLMLMCRILPVDRREFYSVAGVFVLMHGVDIDQRDYAPDLRDQGQAEHPSTKALESAQHRPLPPSPPYRRTEHSCCPGAFAVNPIASRRA